MKQVVRSQLLAHPQLDRYVTTAWRKGKWTVVRAKWSLAARRSGADRFLDVRRLLWVSPAEIEWCARDEFNAEFTRGRIEPGDWDLATVRFAELDIAVAAREVYAEGAPWSETRFFDNLVRDTEAGRHPYGLSSREDVEAHCRAFDRLHESMVSRGYLTAEESQMAVDGSKSPWDEVSVGIARDGRLLFCNGAHRLALAQSQTYERIPVVAAVRHPQWMAFRKAIEQYVDAYGGTTYQPPQHADLATVPAHHSCANRFELIRAGLASSVGTVLDIGANWGYFCHRLEAMGFECTAIEDSPDNLLFLTKLRDSGSRRFTIVGQSFLAKDVPPRNEYTVILALNIFHHFLKSKGAFERFEAVLNRLQADEVFFEPHLPNELQMEGAEAYMSPEELTRFVAQRLHMTSVELLGRDKDGRGLYHMCANR